MSKKIPMSAILLAGGKSSRMGTNKALLPFGKVTVLEHLAKLFETLFQQSLIIVDDKAKYRGLKLPQGFIYEDIVKDSGPLAGVTTGFTHAAYSWCFVATCDMPFINEAFIRTMTGAWQGREQWDALCVENPSGGLEPFPAIYARENRSLAQTLLDLGHLSMWRLFEVISIARWPLPQEFRGLMLNMNTPADYELANARRRA